MTAHHQAYLAAQRESDTPIFPDVRAFPGGGAPKPPQLHYDMKEAFAGAGIVAGYGSSETGILTMASVHDSERRRGDRECSRRARRREGLASRA